jgi:hypothetical protein
MAVMFETQFKLSVRLLLSAVFVLPRGGVSEFKHTHPGGDQPHDHPQTASHDRHVDHDSGDDQCNLCPDLSCRCVVITDCVSHVHVSCFGYHFTYPSPIDSQDAKQDLRGPILTQSVSNLVLCAPAQSVAAEFVPIADIEAGRCEEVIEPASARFTSMPVVAYLCDTARHERSGVQLI